MEQNILLSKIAAPSTPTAWSQAHSTHHLYTAISFSNESTQNSIIVIGKEFIDKLQREFFSIDEKNLETIKTAVSNSVASIPEGTRYSIVIAAVVQDIVYIVISSLGTVLLRRNEQFHSIAQGTENQIVGFSGRLKHQDIIILETQDFAQKFPLDTMKDIPNISGVLDLSESLTPQLLDNPLGTEAALFLQYQNFAQSRETSAISFQPHHTQTPQDPEVTQEHPVELSQHKFKAPSLKLPPISLSRFKNKQTIIAGVIIILLLGLGGLLLHEEQSKKTQEQEQSVTTILEPARTKYEEGKGLLTLNQALALEDIRSAEQMLLSKKSSFHSDSSEYRQYLDLLNQIQSTLQEYETGESISNPTVFFDAEKESIKNISAIAIQGTSLVAGNTTGTVVTIKTDGTIDKTYSIDDQIKDLSTTDQFIYALSSKGISQIDKNKTDGKLIISDSNLLTVDSFGSNVYGLTTTINKYSGSEFSKSSYFVSNLSFKTALHDFSIDSSIWAIETNGTIHKFLRGAEESFKSSGLPSPIGEKSKIYTSENLTDLYILDRANKRVVVLEKNGSYKTTYQWSGIAQANSFGVNSDETKLYIGTSTKIYQLTIKK